MADEVAVGAQQYNWFTEGFDTADLKDAKVLSCAGSPQRRLLLLRGESDRLARCPHGVRKPALATDPFLTDRGCSGFRARFAPERDRER
jgi:hypothetical protein